MKKLLLVIGLIAAGILPAQAHRHHCRPHHHYQHVVVVNSMVQGLGYGLGHMLQSMDHRPSRWCGWYMRRELGVADPAYNLARNWVHYGAPAGGPDVGVVVVWPHHVGRIVGGSPGHWVVRSGNDGHAVRERERSVAGAIAF